MSLLEEIVDAHGGRGAWERVATFRARVRSGGLLLRTRVPGNRFADCRLEVDVGRRRASAGPFPGPGFRGSFEDGAVRIETDAGELVESRNDPRSYFFGRSGIRRNFRWDALDSAYFAGYAWWNYLNHPLLLTRDDVGVELGRAMRSGGEIWRRLDVTFPPGLDTHSARQSFYYDDGLRLRRHDYTPDIINRRTHAAHMCADHREVGGVLIPTRRWVRPVGPGNRPLPGPTLVSLQLSEVEVEHRHGAGGADAG